MQLCESVQYAQLQRSEIVQLCENVQLVHFFQKNLTCFVQGSQYRVFIVQSAESSPKMLKILCNFPKRSPVLCFLHKILRKCWKFLCNMEKIRVLQPEQKALKNVEKNVQFANSKNAQKSKIFLCKMSKIFLEFRKVAQKFLKFLDFFCARCKNFGIFKVFFKKPLTFSAFRCIMYT